MKKILLIIFICLFVLPLYANESNEGESYEFYEHYEYDYEDEDNSRGPFSMPNRGFEIGLSANAFLTNNYLSLDQIFSKTIYIDLNGLDNGLMVGYGLGANFFFNVDSKKGWGFGMSLGVEGSGAFNIANELWFFDEARNANSDASGAVYGVLEVNTFFPVQKFKVTFRPAMFVALMYYKPDVSYTFRNTSEGTLLNISYDARIYTAFPLEGDGGFEYTGIPGFDFSFGVEYPLSKETGISDRIPFLDFDVGLEFVNIPIVSSVLRDYMSFSGVIGSTEPGYIISDDPDFKDGSDQGGVTYHSDGNLMVARPFKVLAWANWRPLLGSNLLTVTPILGFTVNQLYVEPVSLDIGVSATVNLVNILIATAGINYLDRIWVNSIDVALNCRAMQLDFGVELRSQDFLKSWMGSGFGARVGIRFGW